MAQQKVGPAHSLIPPVYKQHALTAAQTLANPLKLKNGNKMPKRAKFRDQSRAEIAPTRTSQAPRRKHTPADSVEAHIRLVGHRCHGGESGIVNSHILVITSKHM